MSTSENPRPLKGNSIIADLSSLIVVDLETTGLSPCNDSIIELSALKVIDNVVVDNFSQLVNPGFEIDDFITNLTGITNEELSSAPSIGEVLPDFRKFIGNDIILGYNVNFDINFLYEDYLEVFGEPFTSDFIDGLRFARKLFPLMRHRRLADMAEIFNIPVEISHRALADCETTLACYNALKEKAVIEYGSFEKFARSFKNSHAQSTVTKALLDLVLTDSDESSFKGDHCCFTGALDSVTRSTAEKMVEVVGGIVDKSVTKKTNYLILGDFAYISSVKDGKSVKLKKAEQLILDGQDLSIIPESVFLEMISENIDLEKSNIKVGQNEYIYRKSCFFTRERESTVAHQPGRTV